MNNISTHYQTLFLSNRHAPIDLKRILVDFNLCAIAAQHFLFYRVASYQKSETEMKTSTQSRGKIKLLHLIALCQVRYTSFFKNMDHLRPDIIAK